MKINVSCETEFAEFRNVKPGQLFIHDRDVYTKLVKPRRPRPHQNQAIASVCRGFRDHDRGQASPHFIQ